MQKKKVFKNYLEPIEFDLSEFKEFEEFDQISSYPFTKEELLSHLLSDDFIASMNYDETQIELKKKHENLRTSSEIDKIIGLKRIMSNLPLEKKQKEIVLEKRRRYQAYKLLDYNLSKLTYFDFFSLDSFLISKNSKCISQIFKHQKVLVEAFLLPFFDSDFELSKVLKEFNFDENFVQKLRKNLKDSIKIKNIDSDLNIFQKNGKKIIEKIQIVTKNIQEIFTNYFPLADDDFENTNDILNQRIKYSYEMHQIFEKSAENALQRFKTPIITAEILFITIMEDKNSRIGKLIKKQLKNETTWYLFRYQLLKRLYNQEANVRSEVIPNQQFFAYLLKTELLGIHFDKLIEKKLLQKAVSLFRNFVITDTLKNDLWISFNYETHMSIDISPKRYYSI
jgi:hypothetical protein